VGCLFAASFVGLVLWILWEELYSSEPILSPRLLVKRSVLFSNAIMFCQAAAQLGMMYTVPMYFQIIKGASTTAAGAYLLPAVGGVTVGGLLGGYWTKRSTRYRSMLAFATICSSFCYALLALRWGLKSKPWELSYIVLGGFGNGLVLSVAFISLTTGISEADSAMATSSSYLSSMIGTTVGVTATSAVIQASLRSALEQTLRQDPRRDSIIDNVLSNIDYALSLDKKTRSIVVQSYVEAFRHAHESNLCFSAVALVVSTLLRT